MEDRFRELVNEEGKEEHGGIDDAVGLGEGIHHDVDVYQAQGIEDNLELDFNYGDFILNSLLMEKIVLF